MTPVPSPAVRRAWVQRRRFLPVLPPHGRSRLVLTVTIFDSYATHSIFWIVYAARNGELFRLAYRLGPKRSATRARQHLHAR